MTHLWVRAEPRAEERRVGLTPEGAAALLARGLRVTVEHSAARAIPTDAYREAGCEIAEPHGWRNASDDAYVFGLKELEDDGTPLRHRHIMFGHAYKGQPDGRRLLERLRAGGGLLLDLEYLVDEHGRRVAAFGYWAGYAGAALALKCLAAQARGGICGPLTDYPDAAALVAEVRAELAAVASAPGVLVIGAKGRVGSGARAFCAETGLRTTHWDLPETAHGGPFPEVLAHEVFLNCILAAPGCPVFVPASATHAPRRLRVIGDIACDPASDFSPVKVYDRVTDWRAPALRVSESPPLDVTAIDNLPSLLPVEASEDYAAQLLHWLMALDRPGDPRAEVWKRAEAAFHRHL
jgi:saccharopine dehydrogenase (NAD+, L-lysine-forming)